MKKLMITALLGTSLLVSTPAKAVDFCDAISFVYTYCSTPEECAWAWNTWVEYCQQPPAEEEPVDIEPVWPPYEG